MLRRMLDMLTSAYNRDESGNIGKLLRLYADTLQEVQTTLEIIRSWHDIEQACGTTLDRIGLTYGVPRAASDDAYYRLRIKVKVSAQISGGTADTIIGVVAALLGIDMTHIRIHELPGICNVMLDDDALTDTQRALISDIQQLAKGACAAGVALRIYLSQLRRYYIPAQMGIVTIHYTRLEATLI